MALRSLEMSQTLAVHAKIYPYTSAKAIELLKRAIAVQEKLAGPDYPGLIPLLQSLVLAENKPIKFGELDPLIMRAMQIQDTLIAQIERFITAAKYDEASALAERHLGFLRYDKGDFFDRLLGDQFDWPQYAEQMKIVARLYLRMGAVAKARAQIERAIAIYQKSQMVLDTPEYADALSLLGDVFFLLGDYVEAKKLVSREIAAAQLFDIAQRSIPRRLLRLAAAEYYLENYADCERIVEQVKQLLAEHDDSDEAAAYEAELTLGVVAITTGRFADAERVFSAMLERYTGSDLKSEQRRLIALNNLGRIKEKQSLLAEAERYFREGFGVYLPQLPPKNPELGGQYLLLARVLVSLHSYVEALKLAEAALEIFRDTFGPAHVQVANGLTIKAQALQGQERLDAALTAARQASTIIVNQLLEQSLRNSTGNDVGWHSALDLADDVERLLFDLGRSEPAVVSEAFVLAQWRDQSLASVALRRMSVRQAAGDTALAGKIRAQQDLTGMVADLRKRLIIELEQPIETSDIDRIFSIRKQIEKSDVNLRTISDQIRASFPDYGEIGSASAVSLSNVQHDLLSPQEALLIINWGKAGRETRVWLITTVEVRWWKLAGPEQDLSDGVQALRCGLDEEEWATTSKASRCGVLLGFTEQPDSSGPLPFHLGRAHRLYKALFGQVEGLIQGKRLLVVASGPLASLPFHVLVTKPPAAELPTTFEGYRNVPWLGRSNAIAMLPAVSSLKALRGRAAGFAPALDYIGYGDPALIGDGGACRSAKIPDACPADTGWQANAPTSGAGRATFRGRGSRRSAEAPRPGSSPEAVLEEVRRLCPLPDTAYEIKCVAGRFKEQSRLVRLGREATKTDILSLNEDGRLASYRVLHFATHGLLPGDVEEMAKGASEPALVLTPPDKGADTSDNGLLTASDIAGLKLNAEWVVLSACNTAAGDRPEGQALSGLARAFFYAGAHALLVSHWPVYSDAAVQLTTHAFAELERDPKAGRAEAFQRALLRLIEDQGQPDNAHPAVWAPFVVVGEGGR